MGTVIELGQVHRNELEAESEAESISVSRSRRCRTRQSPCRSRPRHRRSPRRPTRCPPTAAPPTRPPPPRCPRPRSRCPPCGEHSRASCRQQRAQRELWVRLEAALLRADSWLARVSDGSWHLKAGNP